jgi:Fungalysin/Thermolysin Propeptide Motif
MNSLITSKIHPFLIAFAFSACFLLPGNVFAQKPKASEAFEIIPQENTEYEVRNDMRIDLSTGFPVALYSVNAPVPEGMNAEAQARQFLMNYRATLGLEKADLSDLVYKTSRKGLSGTVVRFNQLFNGIQVYGAEVTVSIDNENRVQFVMSSYNHGLTDVFTLAVIPAQTAKQLAIDYLNLEGPITFEQTQPMIVKLNGQTHFCHRHVISGQTPVGEWEILTDALTGEFLKVKDNALYCHPNHDTGNTHADEEKCEPTPTPLLPAVVNGNGNTFDADPLSSAGVIYGGAYVDGSDANAAVLTAQLANRTLLSIDFTGGIHTLRGPYAYIVDHEAPFKGLFTQASSTFNFDRNADGFEAVNTYYFVDKSMRYLNLTLGVTVMPYQYLGHGVEFDPSGLSGADNSHYTGGSGRIAFGEGGVDDAEDSDVILHELGHGLHDWITSGGLSNVQGLSEGTGDYWTQSYSRSLSQWTSAQASYHYVFHWDGHNPFWGGRTTNYGAVYPGGLTGAIHTDGQIWSTCMMKIYDAIGRTPTDRVLWEGLNLTNGTATQNDAAVAVRQAAINMGYTSGQLNTIITLLQGCGYTVPAAPLGLQTIQFDAERINENSVVLTWTTANACNVKSFEVQRKLEGESDFSTISSINGSADCNTASFHIQDGNNTKGLSWYRLREKDANGGSNFTEVRLVSGSMSNEMEVLLWPQPITSSLTCWLKRSENNEGAVQLSILNLNGQTLFSQLRPFSETGETIEISETQDLAPGMYILRIECGGQQKNVRFSRVN